MALTPYTGEEVDAPKLTPYSGAEVDPTATPSRLRRFVADPLISATKGAIALPEAAVGLADLVSGGAAGAAAERVGFRPKQAKEILDSLYAPEQQQANEEVNQAKGFLNTVGASFRNPSTIAHSVIESAPLMLGGAGVARGLLRAGVPTIAAAAAGEGIVSAGSTAEAVRQETGDLKGMKAAIAAGSGVATAGLGAAGGRLARRFGVVDVDTLLAGGAAPTKKNIAKAIAGGVAIEGGFEEAPQSAQEQAAMNLATGKPLGQGVPEAAAKGAVTGGAMGGGFNAAAVALGVGSAPKKIKEDLDVLSTLPEEEQKPAVQALAAALPEEAAASFEAEVLDRLDAGETAVAPEVTAKLEAAQAAPTREALLEAVTESLGVEENPLEILEQKSAAKAAEILTPKKEVAPAAPVPATPALTRAQLWIKDGHTITKEGRTPDAEVAAHLDDLGYILVPGERADKSAGGSVARREWLVQAKPAPVAPSVEQQAAAFAGLESTPLTKAEAEAAVPRGLPPLAEGEQRLAYEGNPNIVIGRRGDLVMVLDGKNKQILGVAQIKDGKAVGWAEGSEPETAAERSQLSGLIQEHLGGEGARFNRGAAAGLPAPEISAHLAPIIKGLKVPVTVVATASEVPGLKTDVRFTGVYHKGRIYLNAEHLSTLKEAEDILLRHEIRHAGLRSLLGREGLDRVLAKAWGDLNTGVREFAKERGIETKTKAGKLEATEEYIVELAKTDAKHPLWDRFVEVFKAALRRLGFNLKFSDAELRSLVARAGEAVMEGAAAPKFRGLRYAAAWHGSPHKFDKFTTSAIGTGEGAQAYGWGMYFAGAREVAEYYKRALGKGYEIDGRSFDHAADLGVYLVDQGFDDQTAFQTADNVFWAGLAEAKEGIAGDLARAEKALAAAGTDYQKAVEQHIVNKLKTQLEIMSRLAAKGSLYQVELAPQEDEYLLWDKPVSEQSEKVKEALAKIKQEIPEEDLDEYEYRANASFEELTGAELYKKFLRRMGNDDLIPYGPWDEALAQGKTDQAASEYLHSLGVRGIKYPNGEGTDFNYVIFNDEDVEITAKFSRVLSDEPKAFLDHASTQVAKRVLSDISGNIWRNIMAVDRTIEMARSMPLYAPIKDLLARYVVVRKSKAAATDEPLNYGRNLEKAFDKAYDRKAKAVFDELVAKATLYELHANGRDSGWTEKSWKDSGKEEKHGLTLGQARSEVAALYGQLNDEQKVVHRKIIDHMRVLFDRLAEIELAPLKEAFGKEAFDKASSLRVGDASPERLEYLRKLHGDDLVSLAQQVEARTRSELRGDYAPLSRFGNHIVRTLDADGKRIKLQAFESKKKADEAIASIQAAGLTAEYDLLAEANKTVVNIPEAFLNKMRRAAEARGITGDALEDLMDDFAAARVQTMPSTSLAGTGLHREGVEGYDPDMLRSYAAYVNKAGHAIAYAKYGRENEQLFRDMDKAIKDYQKEPGWKPHAVERMSSLRDTLYKLDKTHDVERINEMVKALGKTSFIWYLSSPSIWAVQWSQPFLITVPKLAARHGFTKALAAYVSEAKEYLAGKFSDEKIDAFNVKHENAGERLFALIEEERKAPAERRPGLRKAMKALYDGFAPAEQKLLILKVLSLQGVLDISSSHELMDLITGAGDGRKFMNKAISKAAFFMQKSEAGSRRAAAVSSFRLAMERDGDFAKANDYTADIISDTLGDFTSENRPWLLRGNSGRLFGQFRFFQIHMLGKTVQLAKDAYQEEGWGERRKELSYMLAMSLSLAGAAGTPLSMLVSNPATSAILAAIGLAFGDPDDPWDPEQEAKQFVLDAVGDEAGQAFLYGLPALLGIDVHKRIGLGGIANVVSGEPPPGMTATERAQWYAGRLAGPSFGIVSDTMRAGDAVAEGDLVEAFKMSSPKVIKDAMKAMHLAEKGAVGAGGRVMIQPEDVSPASVALQLLGINPMEVALAQEERREIAALSTALRQRRSLLLKRVTEATLEGDFDAKEEALGAINEWGLKQPGLRISQGELLAALKRGRAARAGTMTKREALMQGMLKE